MTRAATLTSEVPSELAVHASEALPYVLEELSGQGLDVSVLPLQRPRIPVPGRSVELDEVDERREVFRAVPMIYL